MRILVTGGAGFIGSHVCEVLAEVGHEVLAVDNLSRGRRENLAGHIPLEMADVRDQEALERLFSVFRPEVVNHHAAQVSVRDSVADPLQDAEINILGGLNLLQTSVKHHVRRFIFASTGGAIYGEQSLFPAPEDHPLNPLSPYGVAKLAMEKYLYCYQQLYGLSWTALRYSNVYGPRQDPFGEAGVVGIFAQRMLAGQAPIINGDGTQTRDFVYVGDVARLNLLVVEKEVTGPLNVATGRETSVNQIFHFLREITGAKVAEEHGPAKAGEQRRSVLDPSRAKNLLDWEPRVSLPEGLRETAAFFQSSLSSGG